MPILGHVERLEEDLLWQSLKENDGVLLLGDGGAGKTAVATMQAWRLIESGQPVLWVRANSLPPDIVTPDQLGSHIGVSTPFVTALSNVGRVTGECYVFFDQMSFALGTATGRTLCELAQTASAIRGLHVVVICRGHHARTRQEILQLRFPTVEVRALGPSAVTDLLRRLGVESPTDVLVTLGENILQLSMIAELASNGTDVAELSGELQLWKRYLEDIKIREGAETLNRAVEWAIESLEAGRREWYVLAPDPDTDRLIARGVVVEVQADVYAFRHERLHDFLYAWDATRARKGGTDVLAAVDTVFFPAISDWMIKIYAAENPELAVTFAREVLIA